MNTIPPDDKKWQALLAMSAPTFTGDDTPAFGFVTSTLARLKAEKGERDMFERIGLRALFASLVVLVGVVGFSAGLQLQERLDLEPSVNSLAQAEDIPIA